MSELTESISESIKKNMPQQIGEELQKELAELAELRIKSANQKETINANADKMNDYVKSIQALNAELAKHKALDAREIEVHARELKQDFKDFEVAQSKERRQEMLGLVGMVFKSPVYQTHVSGKVPVPVEGVAPGSSNPYGTPGMVQASDVFLSTTNSQL